MTTDQSAVQLHVDLRAAAQSATRPIIHHLNADSSWLLRLPRPDHDATTNGRKYFNVLIDPWLAGSQTDYVSWFSRQTHGVESAVPDIAAAEELLRKSEPDGETSSGSSIDAVVISHEYTDHCHKETLLQVNSACPVYATTAAAKLVSGWKHFDSVFTVPAFEKDWQFQLQNGLPSFLSIHRLTTSRDMGKIHSAVLIAFDVGPGPECIIYTPHGITPAALEPVMSAKPTLKTLALIHGLHDITLAGSQLNLGAENGVKAQRMLKARYWIGTHDEVKPASGLVSFLLGRRQLKAEDVLDQEGDAEYVHLDNGESKVLV